MTSMKIVQFSRRPTPLVQPPPKFIHPLDLGRPTLNKAPLPLQMIINQLKGNIILGLSGLSFRSAFVFSINLLILSGFQLTSFHLDEANLVPVAILKN